TALCTLFVIIMLKISEDLLSNNIVCLLMISLAAFVGNIIARRTGVVHLEPSYPGFGSLAEHWLFCAVLIIYFLNYFLLYLQFLVTVQITLSRQTKEYLMLHPAFDHKVSLPLVSLVILPTKAASEIMSRQTMLFDKRSSLIFNMMITNRVQSVV
ncbi:hypothetical protein SFRURICE_000661, partial [Spodoptera frugiperda]